MGITRDEFSVHILSDEGVEKAKRIASLFTLLLDGLEEACGDDGRDMAIVRTKLQEAAFFARRAMAVREENQTER